MSYDWQCNSKLNDIGINNFLSHFAFNNKQDSYRINEYAPKNNVMLTFSNEKTNDTINVQNIKLKTNMIQQHTKTTEF